jgi:sugar/nucleoside kinase (ribokinase family)
MQKRIDVFAIGTVYLDINCLRFPFNEALYKETETIGQEYRLEIGGTGVITSMVATQLGLKSAFMGKVGKDTPGQLVQDLLRKHNIESALIVDEGQQTNLGLNFINEQGVTIMAVAGSANQTLTRTEVMNKLENYITEVKYLYLGGYLKLREAPNYYPQLISLAHVHNTKVVLDHGRVTNLTEPWQIQSLRKLISSVDIYLPSRDEFLSVWESDNVEAGLKKVRAVSQNLVIVKQGERGATSIDEYGRIIHESALSLTPLNTVGAGDSFNAGFIVAHSLSYNLRKAMKFANATAALKISRSEPPNLIEVENMLQ